MKKAMKNVGIILIALVAGGIIGFIFEQFNIPAAFIGVILAAVFVGKKSKKCV